MPATYSPLGHARLSPLAAALSAESLDIYAMEAEAALGIAGTSYTDNDAAQLTLAVARQVNRTVAIEKRGDGLGDVKQEAKGDQSYTYSDSGTIGLDSLAAQIVAQVIGASSNNTDVLNVQGIRSIPTDIAF